MCGNGLRCATRYLYDNRYTDEVNFELRNHKYISKCEIGENSMVRVEMPKPTGYREMQWKMIGEEYKGWYYVNVGVPHLVKFFAEERDPNDFQHLLTLHDANVNVAWKDTKGKLRVRTLERGCGETEACGSGCCAVVWCRTFQEGMKDLFGYNDVDVIVKSGQTLKVSVEYETWDVELSGPAERISKGVYVPYE